LNEMVTNAMIHIPDCVDYLSTIKNSAVFKFCAIPQVLYLISNTQRKRNIYNLFLFLFIYLGDGHRHLSEII